MNSRIAVFALMVAAGSCALAASDKDIDALLVDAVRYANTPEKHAAKEAAREELLGGMPASLREAMNYVHGDNVMLQVLVMEWVTQLPKETIVPTLLEFVNHERDETRKMAIFFLGFHDAPENAGSILPALDNEKCRGATIRTLGKWKVQSAVPDIIRWMKDGNERVRVVAANALRDIGDATAIPALEAALDDPVFTVRNTAARALISFGAPAVDALRGDLPRLSPRAQEMASRCLSDLQDDAAKPVSADNSVVEGAYFVP